MVDFPCWLSPKDKAIALALIEKAGFDYLGSPDQFGIYDITIATILGWRLGSAYGEAAIEVVKDGAVFGKCLEVLPDCDFKQEVKLTKRIIRAAASAWDEAQSREFTQLTLPLTTECKKSHQSSSFGRKAPPKIKAIAHGDERSSLR